MTEFSAALICGGESRRMGRDKATLEWQRQPLWKIQLAKLRALQPREIFVAARVDPEWRPSDCLFVSDQPPSIGPLSGLLASLTKCATSKLLVLAIDLPALPTNELRRTLMETDGEGGCVPFLDNRPEPLAAVYPVSSLALAQHRHGEFSLRSLVQELLASGKARSRLVPPGDRAYYLNINWPDQVAHLT